MTIYANIKEDIKDSTLWIVVDVKNSHVFGAYTTKQKAINTCVNMNKVGRYYVQRVEVM